MRFKFPAGRRVQTPHAHRTQPGRDSVQLRSMPKAIQKPATIQIARVHHPSAFQSQAETAHQAGLAHQTRPESRCGLHLRTVRQTVRHQSRPQRAHGRAQRSEAVQMCALPENIQESATPEDARGHSQQYAVHLSALWAAAEHEDHAKNASGRAFGPEAIQMRVLWQRLQTRQDVEGGWIEAKGRISVFKN